MAGGTGDHRRDLLRAVTAAGRAAFDAAACSVALVDGDGALEFVAASGEGADRTEGTTVAAGAGIAGYALASGEAVAVGDVTRDSRFARDVADQTGYVPRTILAAPVWVGDDPAGVVEVLDPAPERASALELLGRFADAVAAAVAATEDPGGAAGAASPGRDRRLVEAVLAAVRAYDEEGGAER